MTNFSWLKQWLTAASPTEDSSSDAPPDVGTPSLQPSVPLLKRIGGAGLVILGYLLSPLCWWNDLVFNLPLALGFGYLSSQLYPSAFAPLTVIGYWLSNVVGFMLMQQGAMVALQKDAQSQNLRKAVVNGMLTSTAYTVLILGLLQLHIVETPDLFSADLWSQLEAMIPDAWAIAR